MTGQELVKRIAAWLEMYVWFPTKGQSTIVALWVLHSWMLDSFSSTPYLCVTARTKRAGKTTLLELLAAVTRNGTLLGTMRPAAVARLLHGMDGKATLCFDEMEGLSRGTLGDVRSILTTGYRRGSLHIVSSGDKVKGFKTFGAKAFALIGDLGDVIRDRAIIIRLQRAGRDAKVQEYGNPAVREKAHAEAAELAAEASAWSKMHGKPAYVSPEFLHGREAEIWLPIWTLAHHAGLVPAELDEVASAMVDISAIKKEDTAQWMALAEDAERDQDEADSAEQLLIDAKSVLGELETKVRSQELVDRLRALPKAPWRTWRGNGLDVITMAALLSRFGVEPKSLRFGKGKAGDNSNVHKGYEAAAIRAAKV